jgi:hypothetical protein
MWKEGPLELARLIDASLSADPRARPRAAELARAFQSEEDNLNQLA